MLDELETAQREVRVLRAQLDELLATNAKLVGEIAKLNDRVAELLAIAQRKQRKTTTPAQKKPEPPPVLAADAQQAFQERPKPPALPDKTKASKAGTRRTGRSAIPEHLEAEEHRLRPGRCEHCGSTELDAVDELVEEKLHVGKEHQRRRVVKRTTCRCRSCLKRTTPASLPAP